jgi:hypothetical protein
MEKVPELAPTFSIQSFPISFSIQSSPISFSIQSFPQIQPNSRKVPAKLVRFQVFGFFCACISSQTSFLGTMLTLLSSGKGGCSPSKASSISAMESASVRKTSCSGRDTVCSTRDLHGTRFTNVKQLFMQRFDPFVNKSLLK